MALCIAICGRFSNQRRLISAPTNIPYRLSPRRDMYGAALSIMSSIFLLMFLCLGSRSAMSQKVPQGSTVGENLDSHTVSAKVQVLSREEQCKAKDIETIGRCINTVGNGFSRTLEHRACRALWCPETDGEGKRILCRKTANVKDYTPCSESQVCRRGSCVRVPGSYRGPSPFVIRHSLPPFPGGQ